MNQSTSPTCSRCGAPIPAGAADRLCPACLMSGALKSPDDTTDLMPPSRPPAASEPKEFPCEFGGYRLRGLLGRGGMGAVYDAEEIAGGRRVALKMLGHGLDTPEMRQRFLREGRLAAGVSHPNSLYVFGSEEIDGLPVITMEIAGSGTLKDKLRRRGPLPVAAAVDAILDVIAGLEAANALGVLHRDVKPSNCFVSPDGSVKIGDFGLSVSTLKRDDSYVTAAGVVMGTPAYASPEQLRGDDLDLRADIYSVGATLFTLLTGQAPFEGENAVQVVANAVNQVPKRVSDLREDVPSGLERVVARCLSKEPDGRYADYAALRDALLPFSSMEPEPASLEIRASAGWIDYLLAFLVPYIVIVLSVGNAEFHFGFLVERTLYSARYYIALLGFGFLYFSIVEGIWGAGLGKQLKGLRAIRAEGRPPGMGRAFLRIFIPILCCEGVRIPFLLATISLKEINQITGGQIWLYVGACNVCPWIPILLTLRARAENGYATVWDIASGTRVVVKPKGTVRPSVEPVVHADFSAEGVDWLGPYRITKALVPGKWVIAADPVLRRQVWLLRRDSSELSPDRRNLARPGRMRWLQSVATSEVTWDAFEATEGIPFCELVQGEKRAPWGTLRHWLHDLASELWEATRDRTLPVELSLDHVWVTHSGRAVLLDVPWPDSKTRATRIPVGDLAGQQRFLSAVAACVEPTSVPLHARPVLQNLKEGKFEKLSFLTGTLRGFLDKPAEVSRGIRFGSIFMLPLYIWLMIILGISSAEEFWQTWAHTFVRVAFLILAARALIQLLELPLFRTTSSHSTFGLVMIGAKGERADRRTLLRRWAIVWLPLILPLFFLGLFTEAPYGIAFVAALTVFLLWMGAAVSAVIHPNRGLHDRLAGTWVVRC